MEPIIQEALEAVARQKRTTIEAIRAEIEEAIDQAWSSCDPAVIFFHEDIHCEGEKPTPEELLAYLCLRIFFCDLLKNP